MSKYRSRCSSCGWIGPSSEVLMAENPFCDDDTVAGCPECRHVNCTSRVCDEPGCDKEATCGFPTKDGYRHTCGKHQVFLTGLEVMMLAGIKP